MLGVSSFWFSVPGPDLPPDDFLAMWRRPYPMAGRIVVYRAGLASLVRFGLYGGTIGLVKLSRRLGGFTRCRSLCEVCGILKGRGGSSTHRRLWVHPGSCTYKAVAATYSFELNLVRPAAPWECGVSPPGGDLGCFQFERWGGLLVIPETIPCSLPALHVPRYGSILAGVLEASGQPAMKRPASVTTDESIFQARDPAGLLCACCV